MINFFAFIIGLVIAPRVLYRAFLRGRHSGNFYGVRFQEHLLEKTIDEARRELRVDQTAPPTLADTLVFSMWAAAPVVLAAALIAGIYALLLR